MEVDAENSSHMKKSILHLIEMFKQPKYMNKNDSFFGGGVGTRTYQTAIHMYEGYTSLGTVLALGQILKIR